jgi:hypothetical protein
MPTADDLVLMIGQSPEEEDKVFARIVCSSEAEPDPGDNMRILASSSPSKIGALALRRDLAGIARWKSIAAFERLKAGPVQ